MRVDAGAPFRGEWAGRGAASGDIDNDGDVDLIVSNVGQKAMLLRNDGGNDGAGWRFEPSARNRTATGSVRASRSCPRPGATQHFTIATAAGYLSASDKRLLVGLNSDATAKLVEIRWPSGTVQTFENVKARTALVATESSSAGASGTPR